MRTVALVGRQGRREYIARRTIGQWLPRCRSRRGQGSCCVNSNASVARIHTEVCAGSIRIPEAAIIANVSVKMIVARSEHLLPASAAFLLECSARHRKAQV